MLTFQLALLPRPRSNSEDSLLGCDSPLDSTLKLGPEFPELLEPKLELYSEEFSWDLDREADSSISLAFRCFPFFGLRGMGTSSCSFEDMELLRSPLLSLVFRCLRTRLTILVGLVFSYFFFHFFNNDLYLFFIMCYVRTPLSSL